MLSASSLERLVPSINSLSSIDALLSFIGYVKKNFVVSRVMLVAVFGSKVEF